jgi:hypothetical protein
MPEEKLDARIDIRCTKEDRQLIESIVEKIGSTKFSTVARELMLKGARDMMKELEKQENK